MLDQHHGAWIKHIIKYWTLLAKWWCRRKKRV